MSLSWNQTFPKSELGSICSRNMEIVALTCSSASLHPARGTPRGAGLSVDTRVPVWGRGPSSGSAGLCVVRFVGSLGVTVQSVVLEGASMPPDVGLVSQTEPLEDICTLLSGHKCLFTQKR